MNETFCQCKRCGYSWEKRIDVRPKACPECKRRDWDKEQDQVVRVTNEQVDAN